MEETIAVTDILNLLKKIETLLIADQPFFGTTAAFLEMRVGGTRTMATDMKHLFISPEFVMDVLRQDGADAVKGVLAHEVCHVALLHPLRRGDRDPVRWNRACDYAVNIIVLDAGFKLPTGKYAPLVDEKFRGMSAEEIYKLLPENPGGGLCDSDMEEGEAQGSDGAPDASGTLDDHGLWKEIEGNAGEAKALEREWQVRVAAAAEAARRVGKLPGSVAVHIDDAVKPKVSWRDVTAAYVHPRPVELDWLSPDRRLVPYGIYTPGLGGEVLTDAVFAVDTSGSISDEELSQFLAEGKSFLRAWPNMRIWFAACDAEVSVFEEIDSTSFEEVKKLIKGRGGTDFRPVFDMISEKKIDPSVVVYLTDGYGFYPDRQPSYPVLWVLVPGGQKPPWGAHVEM